MKYGSLNNKHSSTRISYTKGGVSHKVFAKAFGVPVGTKQATIDGSEVGETYLRYGASLKCTEVKVKLVGDELVAQTSFFYGQVKCSSFCLALMSICNEQDLFVVLIHFLI